MKTFSKIEINTDLDNIIPYLEDVHPNPFANILKSEFEEKINFAKNNVFNNMSLLDFYFLAAPIVSSLKDGHTGLDFPIDVLKELNPFVFPFKLSFRNNKIYSLDNQKSIPADAEIIRINNQDSSEIIKSLNSLISAENEHFKLNLLSKYFYDFFEYKEEYIVEYLYKNEIKNIILKGIRFKKIIENEKQPNSTKKEYYSYSFIENNTALFNFNSFVDYEKFVVFLKDMFQEFNDRNVQNVIIDIRENGGGNSLLGEELLQYISNKNFFSYGIEITKYSEKRKDFYDNVMREGVLSYLTEKEYKNLFKYKNGTLIIDKEFEEIKLRENRLRFKGKVFLLTSNYTFSSATDFAYNFQFLNIGKVIGEKTGGSIVSFGDVITTTLPETNMNLYISHREFYPYGTTEKDRRPVKPEYEIESEKALDFTINLIEKQKINLTSARSK